MTTNSTDKPIVNKICPRCGRKFQCKHDVSCWCVGFSVSKSASEFMKSNYSDCLCESCLKEICQQFEQS